MKSVAGITARYKLWLETAEHESAFGGGKWRLLGAIEKSGSLSSAADRLGISYRKAWGDIRKTERALGVKLLERHRGGRDGGEMRLTGAGKKWLAEYGRFEREVESAVAKAYDRWQKRMKDSDEGGSK